MARLATLIPERLAGRKRQIERNLVDAAKLIEAEAKRLLDVPYPRASTPGESPRRRTGHLRGSQYARADLRTQTIEIGNTAPYAQSLIERGRLWNRTAMNNVRAKVDDILLRRGMPWGGLF